MKFQKASALLVFFILSLMACSGFDDEDEVLSRYNENGEIYSPTEMKGFVYYMPSMKAASIRIVNVNESLTPIDSFEVPVDSLERYSIGFKVGMRDYEYPYVKLVTVFPLGKNGKMEFSQYADLSKYNYGYHLQIYGALISGRVEVLVRKENYSLNNAKAKAYEELEKALGMDLEQPESRQFRESDVYSGGGMFDLRPYVLCRHEISDSLFYSDFKELRDEFAKNGTISASKKVRAADAWLSTFKVLPNDPQNEIFKSETRDTSASLKLIDTAFFNWAYALNCSWKNDDSIKISNEHSQYDGRMFVYERLNYGGKGIWRLSSTIEGEFGTCRYGKFGYSEIDGVAYLCKDESFIWEKESNIDSAMDFKYSQCAGRNYGAYGKIGTLGEQMYVCNCTKDNVCGWEEVKKDFKWTELDVPTVNVLATFRYGECKNNSGEKRLMDSTLVLCYGDKWIKVDSVTYNLGVCYVTDRDKYGKMPNGDYYKCKASESEWKPTTAIEANGVWCDDGRKGSYRKFDDKYYFCNQNEWREVPEDSVFKPVVMGDSCDYDHAWEMKMYFGEYFICRGRGVIGGTVYNWQRADSVETELFVVNETVGAYCKQGRTGTTVLRETQSAKMYACMESEATKNLEITNVTFYGTKVVDPSQFALGKFVNDSTYEVVVDSTTYGFKWNRIIETNRWNRTVTMMVDYVKYGSDVYNAVLNSGKLIIFTPSGKDSIDLLDIEPASESFKMFYPTWYLWVEAGNTCDGRFEGAHFPIKPFKSKLYSKNAYVTYEQAKAKLPKGFYIPDTTEWKQVNLSLVMPNVISSVRDVYEPDSGSCVNRHEKHLLLLWSDTEKDANTHYCYGKSLDVNSGGRRSDMLACPDDLYPLAQAIYVKNW